MERAERQLLAEEEEYLSGLIKEAVERTSFFGDLPKDQQEKFLGSVGRVVKFAVDNCSLTALRDTPRMAFMECGARELLEEEKRSLSVEFKEVNRRKMGQVFGSTVHAVLLSHAGGFGSVKDRTMYMNRARGIDDGKILQGARHRTEVRKRV